MSGTRESMITIVLAAGSAVHASELVREKIESNIVSV
jgi:hypothetical protein